MRISDWSSDVCSSDLGREHDAHLAARHRHVDLGAFEACTQAIGERRCRLAAGLLSHCAAPSCSRRSWSRGGSRSEEHTSELQSLMRISYAVFCLKKKTIEKSHTSNQQNTQTTHKIK